MDRCIFIIDRLFKKHNLQITPHLDKGIHKIKKEKKETDLPVFHTNEQCGIELSRKKRQKKELEQKYTN